MKKEICEYCYYRNNCPVDPNYKAERAPTIITTCTDYEPAQDYYEQGTQSIPIDEFTEALLNWLDTPKSK